MPDDTTPAPAVPPSLLADPEALRRAIETLTGTSMQAPTPPPQPVSDGAGTTGFAGFIGKLGNAISGGPTGLLGLTPEEDAAAGRRALLASGIGMLAASGPSYAPKDFGTVLAAGLQNAMNSRAGSDEAAFTARGAQQALTHQQFQDKVAAIREALPLLQYQTAQQQLDRNADSRSGRCQAYHLDHRGCGQSVRLSEPAERHHARRRSDRADGVWRGQWPADRGPARRRRRYQEPHGLVRPRRPGCHLRQESVRAVEHRTARATREARSQLTGIPGHPEERRASGDVGPGEGPDRRRNPLLRSGTDGAARTGWRPGLGIGSEAAPSSAGTTSTTSAMAGSRPPLRALERAQQQPRTAPAAPPGVQMGGDAPPPPGGSTAAVAPYTGGGIGAALQPPTASARLPLPPAPPAEGIPVPGSSAMRLYPDGRIGEPGRRAARPSAEWSAMSEPSLLGCRRHVRGPSRRLR